mmetsp:Transcript_70820/g.196746  ORF Transcript_70820/g.196746 Transcript_70820/m.196746 type:complete len:279 (-) Transcript_70820:81-917(-)
MAREVTPKYGELPQDAARPQTSPGPTTCSFEDDEDSDDPPISFGRRRIFYAIAGIATGSVVAMAFFALGRSAAKGGFLSHATESKPRPAEFSSGSTGGYTTVDDAMTEEDLEHTSDAFVDAATTVSADWRPRTSGRPVTNVSAKHRMTLYHQTSPQACRGIVHSNFRLGKGGWCGKGIYFAMSPDETRQKAVTDSSGHGCMLEAVVDVGRIQRFSSCGRYNAMTGDKLRRMGYDSIMFEPPERTGDEVIIFDPRRVLSKRVVPFDPAWMAKRWYGKPR